MEFISFLNSMSCQLYRADMPLKDIKVNTNGTKNRICNLTYVRVDVIFYDNVGNIETP